MIKMSTYVSHEYITFNKGGFPQLQVLQMVEIDVNWVVDSEASQSLPYLIFCNCPSFTRIPKRLKQVITLRHVNATWCSTRFEKSL